MLTQWSSVATAAPHPALAQRSRLALNRLKDYQSPGRLWRCVRERADGRKVGHDYITAHQTTLASRLAGIQTVLV